MSRCRFSGGEKQQNLKKKLMSFDTVWKFKFKIWSTHVSKYIYYKSYKLFLHCVFEVLILFTLTVSIHFTFTVTIKNGCKLMRSNLAHMFVLINFTSLICLKFLAQTVHLQKKTTPTYRVLKKFFSFSFNWISWKLR